MSPARSQPPAARPAGRRAVPAASPDGPRPDIAPERIAWAALARRTSLTKRARTCPHCRSGQAVLNGKDQNGRQRFKCRGCRRTYNILTGTPMARARKPEIWGTYLAGMTRHVTVRQIRASGIGLNHVTVWRWRHRFLHAAANDNAGILSGVIEADHMFFPRSFKGCRRVQRDPQTPGRGRREAKVPVLTALDSNDRMFEIILSSLSDIEESLYTRIREGSLLCSGGAAAYVSAAGKAGARHRAVLVPSTAPTASAASGRGPRRARLGRVSAHHRRAEHLVNERCHGVATKYLGSYLGWNRAMGRPGFEGRALLDLALA